jgi:hypothetical protein
MPINKETPTRMHRRGETYVTLPSSTIAAINDAVALGIITYLLDKPEDWIPRKTDICKRLNIGPAAWKKATAHLLELGLYLVMDIRNEKGQFVDQVVSVSAVLTLNVDLPCTVNTVNGESAPIHITDKTTHNISLSKRFTPPTIEQLQEYQAEKGFTFDPENFIDYWSSVGWKRGRTPMKDWKATARTWARNESNGNTNKPTGNNKDSRKLSGAQRTRNARAEAYRRKDAGES